MSEDQQKYASKGQLKYFSQANKKCENCEILSNKMDNLEKQITTIAEILSEHKVLLDKIANQNSGVENMMKIFPITSDDKLKELNSILSSQGDPYVRQMRYILKGNVDRNLHEVLGYEVIMAYNVDGTHGKKPLKQFMNIYAALIDIISTYDDKPDERLRVAFQKQKKKFFKQTGREKSRNKENEETVEEAH